MNQENKCRKKICTIKINLRILLKKHKKSYIRSLIYYLRYHENKR